MKQAAVDPNCSKSPIGGHFWKVEPQNGKVSGARCKYCGIVREFYNSNPSAKFVVPPPRDYYYDIGYRKSKSKG